MAKDRQIELDEKDFMLIDELSKDATLSEKKLARRTGIPMTTVHNRLRKLREFGVIKNYTLRLDYAKLGRPLVAFVLVKVMPGTSQKEILDKIASIHHVCEVAMITGDFDIIFKARVATMEELNEIVVRKLRMEKSIGDTRTMLSYETIER